MLDKVFEKIGIYDIMGLWMPGVIITTYGVLTLQSVVEWVYKTFKIASFGLEPKAIYVLMFSVVAYTVGTVLHELGKIIFEIFEPLNLQKISYFGGIANRPTGLKIIKQIQWEYNVQIDSIKINNNKLSDQLNNGEVTFSMAHNALRYKYGLSERIGKTHAMYGSSRSLLMGFCIHLIITVWAMYNGLAVVPWICGLDVALVSMFAIRSYRYLLFFARNVYVQYFFCEHSDVTNTVS